MKYFSFQLNSTLSNFTNNCSSEIDLILDRFRHHNLHKFFKILWMFLTNDGIAVDFDPIVYPNSISFLIVPR